MKNLILTFLLFTSMSSFTQVHPHTLGVRLNGSHHHYGGELSYQLGMGDANRLELDLGWRSHKNWSALSLSGIYHWVWNITDGLNWYAGPGARISMFSGKDLYDDDFGISLGGQLGLEYDFNDLGAPLLLSVDIRPMWNFIGDYAGFGYGSALGIRYTF